ncbi:histidine kinase [Streptomyces deserti]
MPLIVAAVQVLAWPGAAVWSGQVVSRADMAVALVAGAVATVALGMRRHRPLVALGGVTGVSQLALFVVPSDAVVVSGGVGEVVAVYSVAARTSLPVTLKAVAVVVAGETLVSLVVDGVALTHRADLALTVVLLLCCAGLGRGRARWQAGRQEAADRLARAQAEREEAAAGERRRLARELHDVSAHHLTSVVVTANAARHLAADRPELAAEALDFAARTGRETLETLHRLVAALRTAQEGDDASLTERIGELASGFVRLGQRIVVDVDEGVAVVGRATGEAVFGIAREALTNALRYAPGSRVRVAVRDLGDGRLALTVDNDGAPGDGGPGAGRGLGSGRGVTGMRERAAAVGGTVTAGPRRDGGWSVRAELPTHPGGPRGSLPGSAADWRFAEHAALIGVLAVPAALLFDGPGTAAARPLLATLLVFQMLPLLWRRRAPWPALVAVLAGCWLWPWAPGPADSTWTLVAGGCALLAAVYAVGAYGRDPWASWAAIPLADVVLGGAVTAAAARDGVLVGDPVGVISVSFVVVATTVTSLPVLGGAWLAGFAVRSRRVRIARRDDTELGAVVREALAAAHAERQRVAAGLRAAVLDRAADVVRVAEEGRLDGVAPAAREALAAMRELLGSLRDGTPADSPRAPQPTATDLARLCHDRGAVLHAPADLPGLPEHVGLTVHRLVDTALGAGSAGAQVRLVRTSDGLTLALTGVPDTTAKALRPRTTAAEGRLTVDPATGTIHIRLPVTAPSTPVT